MNISERLKESNIFDFPKNEELIFDSWKKSKLLDKIKESRKDGPKWNFLDGPPFVNGNPHHGHLLVSTIKDVLARYHSNKGYQVSYQIGFDCHGLPMEQAAEKELGKKMSSDANIEEISVFNKKCQEIQDRCSDRFETVLSRLGRQFESDKTYYTSNLDYMNALWYGFKILFEKNLIYRGKKVMPYSYGCQTALSNFEANQNYQSVSHTSLYLKFQIKDSNSICNNYFLVWTTTPWSLLANQALCLNPDLEYVLVKSNKVEEKYWVAKNLYSNIFKEEEVILETKLGKELKDIEYFPVFNFFNQVNFKTLVDSYVTSESGTGIVHMAPLFGADDFRVCQENKIVNTKASNLPDFLDSEAKIKVELNVNGDNLRNNLILETGHLVINYLKKCNLYFKKATIVHKYPFCWRTDTPLIYLAQDSWFLNVQEIKDDLIKNNSEIKWFPEFVGTHRFNNWLEGAPDWCLSRDRFWGTPIPIWKSDDDDYICIGSREELSEHSDSEVTNLHREYIDDIIIEKEGKKYHRIPAVFDCWYESGMAGIAKEGKNCANYSYPVDFIAESLDQTRGWFYTLNVLSTALYNRPAFKEVIVSGLILASDGMKMSKRLNNYTPPEDILKKYGADVLRLYLLSSPATQAQEFRFVDKELYIITKKLLPYFHSHKMLSECLENIRIKYSKEYYDRLFNKNYESDDLLDTWILNLADELNFNINENISKLELYKIPDAIFKFIDELTNIWVKFSRERLKNYSTEKDLINSINTLFKVLIKTNKILSPFMPFNSDYLYKYINFQRITDIENLSSIHLEISDKNISFDERIIESVNNVYNIIEIVRNGRQEIRNKYDRHLNAPIRNMGIYLPGIYREKINTYFDKYIKDQCNVENVIYHFDKLKCIVYPKNGSIGKKFKRKSKEVVKLIKQSKTEDILNNKVYFDNDGESVLINMDYCYLVSESTEEKKYHHTIKEGIYTISLDVTIDEDILWKTKLALWKREIQELRKKLNYQFWDNLELIIDQKSSDEIIVWKEYFEKLTSCKIKIVPEFNSDHHQFIFENDKFHYSLNQLD